MRWHEIYEFDQSMSTVGKGLVLDILAPFRAQGVPSITVQQIIDQLQDSPDLDGIQIDQDFIMSVLQSENGMRIEPDPSNMQMTVFLDGQKAPKSKSQSGQEKERIRQSAVRQATRGD